MACNCPQDQGGAVVSVEPARRRDAPIDQEALTFSTFERARYEVVETFLLAE